MILLNKGPEQRVVRNEHKAMKYLFFIILLTIPMNPRILFDFDQNADISHWRIVDDGVMGGRSSGNFGLSPEGFGMFAGRVSLENNGGFSSVRYAFEKTQVQADSKLTIRLKGDGKSYQVRVKEDSSTRHSYIASFQTSGEWQEIDIPLRTMYPSFRGQKLDLPNFSHPQIEELVFLIGNKKAEDFKLLIDTIALN